MPPPDTFPESLEAEQSVLGALLLDGQAVDRISWLRPEHFARTQHRAIYQAILDCCEDDGVIDLTTVGDRLKRTDQADDGIFGYLATLAQNTPSALNVRRYAELVRDRALEREMLAALLEASDIVRNRALPVRNKLDAVQARVMVISEATSREAIRLGEAVPAYRVELGRRVRRESICIPTHFSDLDRRLGGGIRPGDLVIVAGRPSMGKSAFGFQVAENAARTGHPALVLSMEMSRQDLLDRAVAGESRIPLADIRNGNRAAEPNVDAALERISAWPLYIDDSSAVSVHEVRSKARSAKRRFGVQLVVIDYLQLMPGEGENRNTEIAEVTRGLKALTKELEIPVVVLSQLNRALENRGDRRPQLSDLRDSGAIEQDADVVMFVHREEYYRPNDPEWSGRAEILIRKHRQGALGDVRMTWLGHITRFENFAGEWPERGTAQAVRRRGFCDD